jgi:hypothetical protein
MEGELEATPEVELETPAIETEQAEEQPVDLEALAEAETPDEEADQQQEELTQEELDELEWDGKKFKAPKGAKDGFLMHADYTKKTQEVAATRKELEDRAERIAQQAQASEDEIQHRATMHTIDAELARFKDFDWNAYQAARQQDPLGADEAWNYKAHLLAQRQEVGAKLTEAEAARSASTQQEFAKRMHETEQYARSKGWTKETDKQVLDFAFERGIDAKTLQGVMSPTVYEMLYLARIGAQRLQKPAPKPGTQPTPLTTVAAKANPPAKKNVADMDMDEYVAFREKQEAAKRR